MVWNATLKNVGIRGILVLLVFIVGPVFTFPSSSNHGHVEKIYDPVAESASTAEVFRNIQKILSLSNTKPLVGKRKLVKQEAEASEGAANALAYLTDSFGGQLAGQILSVILSSVTGDVRGILGNSLNLFQTDESRDRVQLFLDDISQNFLKFTGLNHLVTTTKSPLLQPTAYPGQPVILGSGTGQVQGIKPASIPISSLGSGSSANTFSQSSATYGGVGGLSASSGSIGSAAGLSQQQKVTSAQQQQPIIYVLPQLGNGETTGTGTSGTKTTGNRVATGDDDSEEDRRLWSA